MPLLDIETRDEIALISMNRPPGNALSLELINELIEAHGKLAKDDAVRAVILRSGVGGFFCEGLDADQLLGKLPGHPGVTPTQAKEILFQRFFEMIYELYRFPKLQFALIEGHAIAGGAVLASLCDFRAMSLAPGRFQFSEVKIGLGIPPALVELVSSLTGGKNNRVLLAAEAFKAKGALEAGLVDMLFEPGQAETLAIRYVQRLLASPGHAFEKTKAAIRAPFLTSWTLNKEETLSFIKEFFTKEFESALTKAADRRNPPKAPA